MGPAMAPSDYWRPENTAHPYADRDEEMEAAALILMDIHRKDSKGLRYREETIRSPEGSYTKRVPEGDAYWAIKKLRSGEIHSGPSSLEDTETLTPSPLQGSRICGESVDTEESSEETEDDVEHEENIPSGLPISSQVTPPGHEDIEANYHALPTLSAGVPLESPKMQSTSPRSSQIGNINRFRLYQEEELGITDAFTEQSLFYYCNGTGLKKLQGDKFLRMKHKLATEDHNSLVDAEHKRFDKDNGGGNSKSKTSPKKKQSKSKKGQQTVAGKGEDPLQLNSKPSLETSQHDHLATSELGQLVNSSTLPSSNRKRKSACTSDNNFTTFSMRSRARSLTINPQNKAPRESSLPTPPDSGKKRTFDCLSKSQNQPSPNCSKIAKAAASAITELNTTSPPCKKQKLIATPNPPTEAPASPIITRRSNRRKSGLGNDNSNMTLEEQIAAREREAEQEGERQVREREMSRC